MALTFDAHIHHIIEITLKRRHWKRDDGTPYESLEIEFINEDNNIISLCAFGQNNESIKLKTLPDETITSVKD